MFDLGPGIAKAAFQTDKRVSVGIAASSAAPAPTAKAGAGAARGSGAERYVAAAAEISKHLTTHFRSTQTARELDTPT